MNSKEKEKLRLLRGQMIREQYAGNPQKYFAFVREQFPTSAPGDNRDTAELNWLLALEKPMPSDITVTKF